MKRYTINLHGLCTNGQFQEPATVDTDIIILREGKALGFLEIEDLRVGFTVLTLVAQANDYPSVLHTLSGEPLNQTMIILARGNHRHLYPLATGSSFRSEPIEGSGK